MTNSDEIETVREAFKSPSTENEFLIGELVDLTDNTPEEVRYELKCLEKTELVNRGTIDETYIWYSPQKSDDALVIDDVLSYIVNYQLILAGFFILGIVLILSMLFLGEPVGVLLSSGAFYLTVGIYLFSQANTCYSIGADLGYRWVYRRGTDISKAASLVAGGGAIYLTLGVCVKIPWHDHIPIEYFSSQGIETFVLLFTTLIAQVLILGGVYMHMHYHKWFSRLEKTLFD